MPFSDSKPDFTINLVDVESPERFKDILSALNDAIKHQRDENLSLRRYSEPAKILRFELDVLRRTLKSKGYYHYFLDGTFDNAQLNYLVNPGKQFTVGQINFNFPDSISLPLSSELAIQHGAPLLANNVLKAVDQLNKHVRDHYCFYKVSARYQVFLNKSENQAEIEFTLQDSQQVSFGAIEFTGLDTVSEHYLRSFLEFKESDCFKRHKLDDSRLALLRTNLIANISIDHELTEANTVSVNFKVTERNHRTIKAGIGFSTDEGAYLTSGWEHRNISGSGEKIDINTRLSSLRQKIIGELYIPNVYSKDTSFTLYSEAINEELDAYEALALKLGGKLGFKRSDHLHYSTGAELKVSDVDDEGEKEAFYLLSFPFEVQWDRTNDILNPTAGYIISAGIRPYVDIINTDISFIKSIFSISAYHSFDVDLQPTLALRYSLGSLSGEAIDNIPADERFYVGGGGSVRGYPYQSLSELNDDDPKGGRSFQQLNTELRLRFLDNWGLVTFLGGGYAFEDATPNLSQRLLWGAGVGLRYYTAFAPFRFDVAFPLDKREDYDDSFQLYISIGQAF
ncbi:MAG: autotransporter assembly complex protein TamA [Oleiphilus sp.]